jgi:predicted pyridoxine 5'-phosphate oxidase superfamily flavin-nucleotide-binding protein
MHQFSSDIAFTSSVKAVQTVNGSRDSYAKMERTRGFETQVTPRLESFLAEMDMFYLGTSNVEGQPYIQYRGGPTGFLRPVDQKTLAFADFGGNQQFITVGTLSENQKAFIFLMDYANSRRIKICGTARVVENDPDLLVSLSDPEYPASPERAILFTIEAWDVNCPQHIHKRVLVSEVAPEIERLENEVAELKARLKGVESGSAAIVLE